MIFTKYEFKSVCVNTKDFYYFSINYSTRFAKVKHINRIDDRFCSIDCLSSSVHILLKLTSDKEALNDFFPIFGVDTISVINYVYILDIKSDGMKDNYPKSENEKDVGLPL